MQMKVECLKVKCKIQSFRAYIPPTDVTITDSCFQKLLIVLCNLLISFLPSLPRHCFSLLRQTVSQCDAASVTSSRTRRFDWRDPQSYQLMTYS